VENPAANGQRGGTISGGKNFAGGGDLQGVRAVRSERDNRGEGDGEGGKLVASGDVGKGEVTQLSLWSPLVARRGGDGDVGMDVLGVLAGAGPDEGRGLVFLVLEPRIFFSRQRGQWSGRLDDGYWVFHWVNAFSYAFVVDRQGMRIRGGRRIDIFEVGAREVSEDT
jgi:hypothetical protein